MKIGVIHEIDDPETFAERGEAMLGDIPDGIESRQFCPAEDGTAATCVWEAESVDELSEFIDPSLGDASSQEYFQINEDQGFGLPE